MALVDLVMPKLGESIMEATILKWHKNTGDFVKQDETVLDIATDKVDSEVPSTSEGVLDEILFSINDVVPIGAVIARIRTNAEENKTINNTPEQPEEKSNFQIPNSNNNNTNNNPRPSITANRFYSPLVLNIASREGLNVNELETIAGTGNEGRVTKRDVLQYISEKKSGNNIQDTIYQAQDVKVLPSNDHAQTKFAETQPTITTYSGNVEIVEMDRMRKMIADHMVRSKHTSPHVTSFTESDVTNLVQWRDKVKKEFEKRENTKITFTPLFIEAIIRCIKKYPLINSSVDGDKIIIKKDINIGMATALPSGSLIVPVIKNADQLNLVGLAKQVNTLAENARNNKLRPDDTQGGTFTMTNVGTFGSLMGTPIINQPQVAILAVGAIKKTPGCY